MGRKRGYKFLSLIVFLLGFFFIDSNQESITGAFLGISPDVSSLTGIILWITAGILFMVGEGGLEKKIKITSSLGKETPLARLAEDATRDQKIQKEMNHLIKELWKCHTEAGIGTEHVEGTDVWYMRGKKGARLFYKRTNYGYDIVGKAAGKGKKVNENAVIKKLQQKYGY